MIDTQKPRILVIDDTPINLLLLGQALARDFEVHTATSGQQGLSMAQAAIPDLILLDVMMPHMDGFETFAKIKATPELKNIPVVFVTGAKDIDSEMKGLVLGAADYITKPINVQIARRRIWNLVERERFHKEVNTQRGLLSDQVGELKQVHLELRDSEERFRNLIELSPEAIVVHRRGVVLFVNPAAVTLFGATGAHDLVGKPVLNLIHPDYRQLVLDRVKIHTEDGTSAPMREEKFLKMDGTVIDVEVQGKSMIYNGEPAIYASMRDVTGPRQAADKLQLAASVFTHAREAIMITSADGNIIDFNDSFTSITGYSKEEMLGKNPRMLNSGRQNKDFYVLMWSNLIKDGHWYGEVWNRRKNGEVFAVMQTISTVRDSAGQALYYVALFSDITAIKEQQSKLEHIAHFDALTNLPNRVLLADRLHQAMAQTLRRGQLLAVAFLDLDGFKAINDNHGHEDGDQLLITVATRMKQALREGDTLARFGGDEFVAVLVDLTDASDCVPTLNRLLAAAALPVHVNDLVLQVTASLGVTFFPQAQDLDADQLLRQADQAMYQAKLAGKNRYHVFDAEQDRSVRGHHESVEHIRHALENQEFVLYYQPKVNMRSGKVVGAEALIRWQHPQNGLQAPAVFLPVIEDHPLAVDIGEWVLNTALNQLEAWHAAGLNIPVSVNVGARQLQQPDFVVRLGQILARHPSVHPGDLELEVLETSALEDMAGVSLVIEACRKMGVNFALDDFGTGYSSLTYLKRLPVTQLKIDQSFVRDMLDDPEDLAILEGVIGLASAFRREVIAEGVETTEHGAMLLQLGCDLAQGYGIAHPLPAHEFPAWAAHWQPDAAWGSVPVVRRDDLPLLFASVEHRAWIAAMEAYLKNERGSHPPLDVHQCHFGRWLDTQGLARYGERASYRVIEPLHRQVHALSSELMARKDQGNTALALERLPELHALRDTLLAQLQTLAHESLSR